MFDNNFYLRCRFQLDIDSFISNFDFERKWLEEDLSKYQICQADSFGSHTSHLPYVHPKVQYSWAYKNRLHFFIQLTIYTRQKETTILYLLATNLGFLLQMQVLLPLLLIQDFKQLVDIEQANC